MSLLLDIQKEVVSGDTPIAPILLKLRLLAAKLGSVDLEEWVKHEVEGYPNEVEVPSYRVLGVSYSGTFSGPFGSGINNAPIPTSMIRKLAGDQWADYKLRQSAAAIDELLKSANEGSGVLHINSADLIPILQGKIYPDYACNSVIGKVSTASFAEVQHAVRSRILELVLKMERNVPIATSIEIGGTSFEKTEAHGATVTNIYNQTINGNAGNLGSADRSLISVGDNNSIAAQVGVGDRASLQNSLERAGIPQSDAAEISNIISEEQPSDTDGPLGRRAQEWLAENLKKAASGAWKIGVTTATRLIAAAASKFYGL